MSHPTLWAISDLHVSYQDNRALLRSLGRAGDADWLLIAGDVGEMLSDIADVFDQMAARFSTVVWVPGNHELWTVSEDPDELRGVQRYEALVELARDRGIHTPEDSFPIWNGREGPVVVAPLFTLYDYSFLPPGAADAAEAMARAREAGIICTDEFFLRPDPHLSRADWCRDRISTTAARLDAIDPSLPTVLVNHWPLVQAPTAVLRYPEFAQWCGTVQTARWHLKYRAKVVVHGHLHIPRTTWYDGVRFEEVSLGYPREWSKRSAVPSLRAVFPED